MLTDPLKYSFSIREEAEKLWETLEVHYSGDDTKLLAKEKEHQELIKEYSSNNVFLDNIFTALKSDNKDIQQEAFLVAIESGNPKIINKVIKWMGVDFTFVSMLYYLSDDAINTFFLELGKTWQELKEIPYEKTVGTQLLVYRKLFKHLPMYSDLNKFDLSLIHI